MNLKKFLLLIIIAILSLSAFSQKRLNKEIYYQTEFAKIMVDNKLSTTVETEHVLSDRTRVDILTDEFAIEADFANKWAESIGQSLYYGLMTNKKPGVLLILEDLDKDTKYLDRLKKVAKIHKIDIWIIGSNLNWRKLDNEF